MRERIAADPFMRACIHGGADCDRRITWEHAFTYAGRQINEPWAIVPCCWYHHLGAGMDKRFNQYVALSRATDVDLAKYPRTDWARLRAFLGSLFDEKDENNQ